MKHLIATAKALIEVSLVKPVKDSLRIKFHKSLAKILTEKGFPATIAHPYDGCLVDGAKKDGNLLNKALKAAGWTLVEGINKNIYLYVKDKAFWPLEVDVRSGLIYLVGESFFDRDKMESLMGKLKLPKGYKFTPSSVSGANNHQLDNMVDFYFDAPSVDAEGIKAVAQAVSNTFAGGKTVKVQVGPRAAESVFSDGSYKYEIRGFLGGDIVALTIRSIYS